MGNVFDVQGQSTYCPNCKECLIERNWHELGLYRLDGNKCMNCGAEIPGVYELDKGTWGRRRLPVSIENGEPQSRQRILRPSFGQII